MNNIIEHTDEGEFANGQISRDLRVNSATLRKLVRDPRTGEVHQPSELVEILRVNQNLGRTLLTIRWQDGGDCVVFPADIEEPCEPVHSEEMLCNTSGEHRI